MIKNLPFNPLHSIHRQILHRRNKLQVKVRNHIIFWFFFVLYELSVVMVVNPQNLFFWDSIFAITLNISTVYSVAYLALPSLKSKRVHYGRVAIVILLLLMSYVGLRYGWARFCQWNTLPTSINLHHPMNFSAMSVWRGMYFVMLGAAYWFISKMIYHERALRKKEELHQKLEKEVLKSKLAFLKAQINPHFLFNILSFMYYQILKSSPKVAEAVLVLSDIMRYALKESDSEGKASLLNELNHITNIIKINQIRFDNKFYIDYVQTGNPTYFRIVPLVLITFVENAIKYGVLDDAQHPVLIKAAIEEDTLTFLVRNKIAASTLQQDSHGIGLPNIRERLQAAYGNKYSLAISQTPDIYEVTLKLSL